MPSLGSSPGFVLKLFFFSNSSAHLIWFHKILYINYCKLRQISRFDRKVTRWKEQLRAHCAFPSICTSTGVEIKERPKSKHPQTCSMLSARQPRLKWSYLARLLFKIVRCRCRQAASFGSAGSSYSAHPLLVARSNGGRTAPSRKARGAAHTQSGKWKPPQFKLYYLVNIHQNLKYQQLW